MAEELEAATESENKKVALIIAVLALFLAFAEAGAKNAQHLSTEKNIEASDQYNFYQAKKIRQAIAETAAKGAEATKVGVTDEKAGAALEKQIAEWKAAVEKADKDPKDSLDKIQERAKEAVELREGTNRKLEHYEYASGALQIAIVLASAAIITGMMVLAWLAGGLGLIGVVILAFGVWSPTTLPFLGG